MNTKIKVSIPISFELLKQIDDLAKEEKENAVELIERVMKNYAERVREEKNEREIEILNRIAAQDGGRILENLDYQVDIWNEENFTA